MKKSIVELRKEYSELCAESLKESKEYLTALELIKKYTKEDVWLIGSMVYGGIIHELYNTPKPRVDLDFIVSSHKLIKLPKGWKSTVNNFGNPKITNGKIIIDFIPLTNIFSITSEKLEPTIKNYLNGVPLNIQSIAYDVKREKVIGDVGIKAICTQEVKVYNKKQANLFAKRYQISINQYIKEKADKFGFKQ